MIVIHVKGWMVGMILLSGLLIAAKPLVKVFDALVCNSMSVLGSLTSELLTVSGPADDDSTITMLSTKKGGSLLMLNSGDPKNSLMIIAKDKGVFMVIKDNGIEKEVKLIDAF